MPAVPVQVVEDGVRVAQHAVADHCPEGGLQVGALYAGVGFQDGPFGQVYHQRTVGHQAHGEDRSCANTRLRIVQATRKAGDAGRVLHRGEGQGGGPAYLGIGMIERIAKGCHIAPVLCLQHVPQGLVGPAVVFPVRKGG